MLAHPHPPPDETPTLPSPLLTLTIFTLPQHPQDETTIPPSPLLTLPYPCLIFTLAYSPYPAAGPSSYASNTTFTPLMPAILTLVECLPNIPPMRLTILMLVKCHPTCLRRCLPSLRSQFPPDMPLTLLTIIMPAVRSNMPLMPPSHWPNPEVHL
ncbi:hypothetical protein O181_122798 [Austropuccinia psidii MF-1]|uniref:Uncharacterized protein n=1 Tax=Austropuccinia psidii MF-1 TaxID=1389203 RepID=A0A9Q3Q2K3_9BASI|nr:hypothetical protein [Austropuccinia psidii MF-1]